MTIDGEQRYLEQPMAVVTPAPRAAASHDRAPDGDASRLVPSPTPTAGPAATPVATAPTAPVETALPPLQLAIAAIGLDGPIVLADNEHLPRIKVAGWLFKSAFPATAGNMVLLGHLDGSAAIFERLHELQPGDEVRVSTANKVHVYVVDSTTIVAETAVELLAPTTDAVLTLVTCAGDWNPATASYSKRLVVQAHYAAALVRQV